MIEDAKDTEESEKQQLLFVRDREIVVAAMAFAATMVCLAKGKAKSMPIKLLSSAGTGYFYTTRKNIRTVPQKLTLRKYDPIVQRHVLFSETKSIKR